ncbi:MAG: 7TM-DISM domain-containing protein, partial [Leptospirales bacterium]
MNDLAKYITIKHRITRSLRLKISAYPYAARFAVLSLLSVWAPGTLLADCMRLDREFEVVDLTAFVRLLPDAKARWDLEDARARFAEPSPSESRSAAGAKVSGTGGAAFWLRFCVQGPEAAAPRRLLLEFSDLRVDEITFYAIQGEGAIPREVATGAAFPFDTRD